MYAVKQKRKKLGISQKELSKKSGVSRTIISALETNNDTVTSTATLLKIADALGCNVSDIFLT
jgi:transcriptional regulator with XRE-family HTH domain